MQRYSIQKAKFLLNAHSGQDYISESNLEGVRIFKSNNADASLFIFSHDYWPFKDSVLPHSLLASSVTSPLVSPKVEERRGKGERATSTQGGLGSRILEGFSKFHPSFRSVLMYMTLFHFLLTNDTHTLLVRWHRTQDNMTALKRAITDLNVLDFFSFVKQ